MRVLMLSNIYPPGFIGGYELGAADIAAGLQAAGHKVQVLTSSYLVDDTGGDAGGGGRPAVHRSLDCTGPSRSPHEDSWPGAFVLPRNLRELAGHLQRVRPDAVLCFNLAGLGAPSILRLLVASGVRPVVYMMDHILHQFCLDPGRRRGFERVFPSVDWPEAARFLFMSQNLRGEVEDSLGLRLSRASIVPGWFDQAAEAEVSTRDTPLRFVLASRIAAHKGIDVLLDACRLVLDSGYTEFTVDVYGAGDVAPTLQRVVALRLSDHVRYCGAPAKPALMPKLSSYDGLLFPTWNREPFGFVVPEAAAAGCIPVMTYGIGAAEWFLDGIDCLKIAREPAALQAAMLRLIGMQPEERTAMRRRAQAVARRFFRFDDALSHIEAALAEAAGPPTRSPRAMEAAMAVLTDLWRTCPNG